MINLDEANKRYMMGSSDGPPKERYNPLIDLKKVDDFLVDDVVEMWNWLNFNDGSRFSHIRRSELEGEEITFDQVLTVCKIMLHQSSSQRIADEIEGLPGRMG